MFVLFHKYKAFIPVNTNGIVQYLEDGLGVISISL